MVVRVFAFLLSVGKSAHIALYCDLDRDGPLPPLVPFLPLMSYLVKLSLPDFLKFFLQVLFYSIISFIKFGIQALKRQLSFLLKIRDFMYIHLV